MALKVVISGRSMAPLNLLTEAGFEVVQGEANTTEELIEITKEPLKRRVRFSHSVHVPTTPHLLSVLPR